MFRTKMEKKFVMEKKISSENPIDLEMVKVAQLFKSGLESLNSAITSVTSTQSVSVNTLLHNAKAFYSSFKEATEEAKLVQHSYFTQLSRLVEEISAKENHLRNKQREKNVLEITLCSHKSELSDLKQQLKDAQDGVIRSKRTLQRAKKQLVDKEIEQDLGLIMGLGLLFVPVVGLVAGPITIGVSLTALDENRKAAEGYLDIAKSRLYNQNKLVMEKKQSLTCQENRIKNVSKEIDQCRDDKERNEVILQTFERKYKRQSEICRKLEDAITYLEEAAGRSQIVYHEIKFFYDLEPLLVPLKSLASHLAPGLSLHPALLEVSAFQNFQLCLKALEESSENESKKLQLTFEDEETMKILSQCEPVLVPAPMVLALALLGQVCTWSLKHDFSLEVCRPKDGFKFLKSYSFRVNLEEITHMVWSAFDTAHVNMDQIHIHSKTLSTHLSNVLQMLKGDIDADFENCFGNCLKVISSTSDRCLSLSKETVDAFIKVTEPLMELQESCTYCKGKLEKQLKENHIIVEQSQEIKKDVDDQRRMHMEKLANIKKRTIETEEQYQNLKQLPGVWEATQVGTADLFNKVLSVLFKPVTKIKKKYKKRKEMKREKQSFEELRSYAIAKTLMKEIQTLNESYVKDGTLDLQVLEHCDKMIAIKSKINHEETRLHNMSGNSVQKKLLGICQNANEICQFLQDFKPHIYNDDQSDEHVKIAKDIKSLEIRIQKVMEQGEKETANESQNTITLGDVPCIEEPENGDFMDVMIYAYRMCSEARLRQLENLQHRYDKEASDLKENYEQYAKILGEMTSLKMKHVDFEETLDVVTESLRLLEEIREQWRKVIQYFENFVATIDCSLKGSLQTISKYAKEHTRESTFTKLNLNGIQDQVLTAKQFVAGLSHVSETYTQVSQEFLLPTAKDLQGILGLTKNSSELKLCQAKCLECPKDRSWSTEDEQLFYPK